jgi:tRNA-dihydrouridine synthase 1
MRLAYARALLLMSACARSAAMLTGQSWWASLGSPRRVAAPMVAQSELAFRLLARRYGAELCYTPMFLAKLYASVPEYRADHFSTCAADRPLIAQLAGHDPATMVAAGRLLQGDVDAIDINLGCPQGIARKGQYGAFLLPDVPRVEAIIRAMATELAVPVTVKVRLLPTMAETLDAVRRFEAAGASVITVHGRTREQNKQFVGASDWAAIARVVRAVGVPVIANGGIACAADVERCLSATGAAAVMSSEGLLGNPALFVGNRDAQHAYVTQRRLAREYLDLAREVGAPDASARSHLFKLLHGALTVTPALRDELAEARGLEGFEGVLDRLCALDPHGLLEPYAHGHPDGDEALQRDALQWYFRYRAPRPTESAEGSELAAGGAAPALADALGDLGRKSREQTDDERVARRVRKAQAKTAQRERHAERHALLARAASAS